MIRQFFRSPLIINTLPVTLTNGTVADATQVMSDLNWIVNQVNANAASLSNTALLNANNNFTAVQSGIAALAATNFPIASQVQNMAFNTLSSTLGTNTVTARVSALPLPALVTGQVFEWFPSQQNTGPVNITIDGRGPANVFLFGSALVGGELVPLVPVQAVYDGTQLNILSVPKIGTRLINALVADVGLSNTGTYFTGPQVAQGSIGVWFVTASVFVTDTGGAASINAKLWDGTTVIASGRVNVPANNLLCISLSGYITSPAGNLRISCQDVTAVTGVMAFNASGNSKDAVLTAIRVA